MFFLRYYLWFAPEVLLAIYLALLFRRKQTTCPVFIAYLGFKLAHFLALVAINSFVPFSPLLVAAYRSVLVAGTGIGAVLELAVIYELADRLIRHSSYLTDLLRPRLRWTVALFILLGAVASALLSYPGMSRLTAAFGTLEFFSSFLRLGLLVSLVLFSRSLHVSWRSLPAGIAVGFGLWAFGQILASTLMSKLGFNGSIASDIVRMSAFHVCVVTWLIYALRNADVKEMAGAAVHETDLELWNQQVERMLKS